MNSGLSDKIFNENLANSPWLLQSLKIESVYLAEALGTKFYGGGVEMKVEDVVMYVGGKKSVGTNSSSNFLPL